MLRLLIELALAALTLCGVTFYLIALWSAYLFRREAQLQSASLPPVSVLKPLKGTDPSTYAALRSHCEQDYPAYEIIFGINASTDEAASVVWKLIAEFPNRDIQLVICSEVFGANRKVSNLLHLLRKSKYPHVLVNDGDIKVSPGYLRSVMPHFTNPNVGMITCLYKGKAGRTLGSRLESLGISTDFAAGVLTARYLEDGLHFGLGSTLAMSRVALDKIGGFEAVLDYLADDYQLGAKISDAGLEVALAREVVETSVPDYSFVQFWEHQLRWARTMRVSRPGGYRGVALTLGVPWSIFLVLAAPHHWWAWTILVCTLLARFAAAISVGARTVKDERVFGDLWLIPVRDMFALAIWAWSYADDTVTWRGEKFRLKDGRMYPIESTQA